MKTEGKKKLVWQDYADEAESARRVAAWPQAAALLRRAISACGDPEVVTALKTALAESELKIKVDGDLAAIAERILNIPTLERRNLDRLDFHELHVGQIKEALRLAYDAGLEEARQ